MLEAHVLDVLARGRSAPAHVLNLGHGVPPDTDPDVLTRLVGFVHELTGEEIAGKLRMARSTVAGWLTAMGLGQLSALVPKGAGSALPA